MSAVRPTEIILALLLGAALLWQALHSHPAPPAPVYADAPPVSTGADAPPRQAWGKVRQSAAPEVRIVIAALADCRAGDRGSDYGLTDEQVAEAVEETLWRHIAASPAQRSNWAYVVSLMAAERCDGDAWRQLEAAQTLRAGRPAE